MRRRNLEMCFVVVVAVLLCGSPVSGEGMLVENATAPFGKFGGIDYVIHTGRLEGSTSTNNYRVPYEIVAPANPRRGNGAVIVEPSHFAAGPAARDLLLGPEFLFGQGFIYAAVGWGFDGLSILDPSASDVFIEAIDGTGASFEDLEIISDFARALRAGPAGPDLGDVEAVYGFGYSATSWALMTLLYSPPGEGLLDFSLLTVLPAAFVGNLPVPFAPPHLGGRMIIAQSEADLILWGGALVRGDDELFPQYRSYELAGMPHIPANSLFEGAPQQDWRPFMRALLVVGHSWTIAGVEPPSSVAIGGTAPGEIDPVYGWPTGIARDEIENALGGVRPPDLELGRGHFVAADFEAPFPPPPGFIGAFVDLKCSDGFQAAFPNHGRYVSAHTRGVLSLVRERFLLKEDAKEMLVRAARSDVGRPGSCP